MFNKTFIETKLNPLEPDTVIMGKYLMYNLGSCQYTYIYINVYTYIYIKPTLLKKIPQQ